MAKIISDRERGTSLFLDNGEEVFGIYGLTFRAHVGDINTIEAKLGFAQIEAEGRLTLLTADPNTEEQKQVAKIIFTDGSEWDCADE